MKNNIYEYFGCSNEYELLDKLKNNTPEIQSLKEFYNHSLGDISHKQRITSSESMLNFVRDEKLIPDENTAILVGFNTQMEQIFSKSFTNKDTVPEIWKSTKLEDCAGYILIENTAWNPKLEKLKGELQEFLSHFDDGMDSPIDTIGISSFKNGTITINSERADDYIRIDYDFSNKILDKNFQVEHSLNQLEGFNDFSSFYMADKLLGKNMIEDESEIMKALKIGKQFNPQEELHLIAFDKDFKINKVKMLFKGSLRSSIASPRNIATEIKNDDISGFSLVHNHPSGKTRYSESDVKATERAMRVGNMIGKPLFEHYIAGLQDVSKLSNGSELSLQQLKEQKNLAIENYRGDNDPKRKSYLEISEALLISRDSFKNLRTEEIQELVNNSLIENLPNLSDKGYNDFKKEIGDENFIQLLLSDNMKLMKIINQKEDSLETKNKSIDNAKKNKNDLER